MTSDRTPHCSADVLPAPRMKVPTSALMGAYSASVGMETNVSTYRMPTVREIRLVGRIRRRGRATLTGGVMSVLAAMMCSSDGDGDLAAGSSGLEVAHGVRQLIERES